MIGQIISHYRIVNQLGAGGMGIVYTAEDTLLGRQVALKFVAADAATDRQAVERLRIEARAASALNHANICTIYEFGEHEGRPFIVMELMKGRTLRDRLTSGALAIHQVVDMGIQIADALDAAHTQGIMHRDIKPANIFLTERGQVKILDFGLAKLLPRHNAFETTATPLASDQLTQAGVAIGTVLYMSPEQATGEDLDARTDLFSFGVVLYECATGRRPFSGKTAAVVLDQILNRGPVAASTYNPEIPPRLQDVIHNCLEKDRELRYQSADGLRADLKRIKRDIESGHFVTAASSDARPDAAVSGTARKLRTTAAAQMPSAEAVATFDWPNGLVGWCVVRLSSSCLERSSISSPGSEALLSRPSINRNLLLLQPNPRMRLLRVVSSWPRRVSKPGTIRRRFRTRTKCFEPPPATQRRPRFETMPKR